MLGHTWAFEKQESIKEWERQRVSNGLLNRSLCNVDWMHEHQHWAFDAIKHRKNKFSFWLPTESGSCAAIVHRQVTTQTWNML